MTGPHRPPASVGPAVQYRRPGALRTALAVLFGLAVLAGLMALVAVRYLPYLDDLRELRVTAQRVSDQVRGLDAGDVGREAIDDLRADLALLDGGLAPFRGLLADDPLVAVAAWLPLVGDQVSGARSLVSAADELLVAADVGLDLADRYVELREAQAQDPDASLMQGLVGLMVDSRAQVDQLAAHVTSARAHLAAIPGSAVGQITSVRDLVGEPLERYAPLLDEYQALDDVLPEMLGWGGQKRYLVLAQNPAELRPAGGYIGTVGILTMRDGRLAESQFTDVYEYDLQKDNPYVEPPPAIRDHLVGNEGWRLADAAWSPHFPTSARDAIRLYGSESGDTDIDGVIAITTYALDRILEAIGPVKVPGYDVTVRAGEVTFTILSVTRGTDESVAGRKAILDVLAETVLARLLALEPADMMPLAAAAQDIARERLVLAWFADPVAQGWIGGRSWAGEVRQEEGDHLYVVDSNVAPTSKYNLVVDRDTRLEVSLAPDGEAYHSLRLDWRNEAGREGEPYASIRSFSTNKDGLYATYTRVLVPADSELLSASGEALAPIGGVARIEQEAGRTVFANYLMIPPGDAHLEYEWTTREGSAVEVDGAWLYRLVVQKQPGHRPESLHVTLRLPEGARLLEADERLTFSDGVGSLETTLLEDVVLDVRYTLGTAGA